MAKHKFHKGDVVRFKGAERMYPVDSPRFHQGVVVKVPGETKHITEGIMKGKGKYYLDHYEVDRQNGTRHWFALEQHLEEVKA